jgi:hypothetical protein
MTFASEAVDLECIENPKKTVAMRALRHNSRKKMAGAMPRPLVLRP